MKNYILKLKEEIISGKELSYEDALNLLDIDNSDRETIDYLLESADELRERFCGKNFDLCTIVNAKSGKCSENCKYCAQSAYFKTNAEVYPLISKEFALCEAKKMERKGTHRFSLVTSGRGLKGEELELTKLSEIYGHLKENVSLSLCASHGICTEKALQKLVDSGVSTYHHNLEASRRFYPEICTTHSYEDRVNTVKNAKAVGMTVCSGGIFGLGETPLDRIDMAFELKNLGVDSIPINILNPVPGTPFEDNDLVEPLEVLKTVAIYRFLMPDKYIRYAGGRSQLGEYSVLGLRGGVNSVLTGDFLTTTGTTVDSDIKLVEKLGYEVKKTYLKRAVS